MQKLKPLPVPFIIHWCSAVLLVARLHAADVVPVTMLQAADDLEVTLWAASPMLKNPTNLDTDKDGRLWVAEGVNYRSHYDRQPEGDRIAVLQDTDGDGQADQSWTFVQEPFLRTPMGIAVIDNKIVVSMTPDLIVYTDVNRDLKFDLAVDKREVILTGINGRKHDHSLHSVTCGPDGQWYWNAGNCGAVFTDKSGVNFRIGSTHDESDFKWTPRGIAGQPSDDGHVYVGGFAARMNPDGSAVHIIGYNFRNSYEQTVTSFGDVFQNDNDDPPACRTTFLLEYGNAGYFSADGKRSWSADRRPGQSTPIAEWRQEDPGTMPPGDVYGGGAPTGIAFYEGGALGEKYRGLLLSCEPGRNTVFGYYPQPAGAGWKLERFNFLTSNPEGNYAGTDFKGGKVSPELKLSFRPSDVVAGADGAIYVCDWFDPRVGGHSDLDATLSGAVYRIAPKGFKPKIPKLNTGTTRGQIAALKSPAVNVRNLGFEKLRAQGPKAVSAVAKLLKDENLYVRARAVWLLSQMGPTGIAKVESGLMNPDPQMRVVAFRALRRQNWKLDELSRRLAVDPAPAVRREVALAQRDVPFAGAKEILFNLARGYDGVDRTYLEAFGTGCSGKESEVLSLVALELGSADPLKWTAKFAGIAWRLHPPQSVAAFKARALAPGLSLAERKAALVALGYMPVRAAAEAVADVARQTTGDVHTDALWWLLNGKDRQWQGMAVAERLKRDGLYDPETIVLQAIEVPEPQPTKLPPLAELLRLKGDAVRGKQVATACQTCHRIGGEGTDYGPDITSFAKMQTREVVLRSIVNPSADIANGFDGSAIKLKDGTEIHGLILAGGDPVIVRSTAGVTQTVPAARIESRKPLGRSLMLSAGQLGLAPQDIADVLAYLTRP
ncbi:MAG: PVC-type heme-binding CxxCH protein [Verrucomicrobiota bacterium]